MLRYACGVPHSGQNLAPACSLAPHFVQDEPSSLAPHSVQNLELAGSFASHFGQLMPAAISLPHEAQNLAPTLFAALQFGQMSTGLPLASFCIRVPIIWPICAPIESP